MKRFLLLSFVLFTLTACVEKESEEQIVLPPLSDGDNMITKEYIDENIYDFYLDLSGMGLTRIPDFSAITTVVQREDIMYLNLSNNQITEISDDLLIFPNLKQVKLDNNQIKKIENIHDITLLSRLDFYKNQIEDIEGLTNLPNLLELDISYNNLGSEDLIDVFQLASLESLQLQHNQIDSIEGIENLQNLKTLKLEYNQINNVDVLDLLENVETLTVGKNLLNDDIVEKWNEFNAVHEEVED